MRIGIPPILETYVKKDVSQLAHIGNQRDFQMLLQLLTADTAQVLNMSKYATVIGVDNKTIKRWISILEASYIIFLLKPFYENYGKRISKRPKIYFYDTGLVSYLTGIENAKQFENGPMAGALFENYVISEVLKRETHRKSHANLYYFRSNHGEEVDLIIDRKRQKEFIEIKKGETFKPKMTAHIENLKSENDRGYLVYSGKDQPYENNIEILNYAKFLESK